MYKTVILLLAFILSISCLSTELCDHNKFSKALVSLKTCVLDNFKKLLQENSIQPSNLIGVSISKQIFFIKSWFSVDTLNVSVFPCTGVILSCLPSFSSGDIGNLNLFSLEADEQILYNNLRSISNP